MSTLSGNPAEVTELPHLAQVIFDESVSCIESILESKICKICRLAKITSLHTVIRCPYCTYCAGVG